MFACVCGWSQWVWIIDEWISICIYLGQECYESIKWLAACLVVSNWLVRLFVCDSLCDSHMIFFSRQESIKHIWTESIRFKTSKGFSRESVKQTANPQNKEKSPIVLKRTRFKINKEFYTIAFLFCVFVMTFGLFVLDQIYYRLAELMHKKLQNLCFSFTFIPWLWKLTKKSFWAVGIWRSVFVWRQIPLEIFFSGLPFWCR